MIDGVLNTSKNMQVKYILFERVSSSPQQVGRPDDGQVLAVHVGDVAERCQVGKVSHEELQGPRNEIFIYSDLIDSH